MENSFGKTLKEHRQQHGLSIKQVSVAIKVNASILEKIEAEDLEQLPKPVFTRGLIRTYCKYLEIEEESVLQSFDEIADYETHMGKRADVSAENNPPKTPLFITFSRTFIPLAVIALLAGAGYGVFIVTQKYEGEITEVKTDDVQAIHTARTDQGNTETAETNDSSTDSDQTSTGDDKNDIVHKGDDADNSSVETTATATTNITQRITLEPLAKTLVQIQLDDDDVQKIILRPDVNRTFQARKTIKLNISDAGAVNIIYNRKDIGVPGIFGQSIDLEFPEKE